MIWQIIITETVETEEEEEKEIKKKKREKELVERVERNRKSFSRLYFCQVMDEQMEGRKLERERSRHRRKEGS